MRVAHILPTLGFGGAERVVVELARCMALGGHKVTIFVGWQAAEGHASSRRLPDSVNVRPISKKKATAAVRYAGAAYWLWSRRRELQTFDVIHCHLTFGAFLGFLLFHSRKLTRVKAPRIIETYHAVGMPIPRWSRWFHSRMAAGRDGLVLMAEDPHWKRFAQNHPNLPVWTILNGAIEPDAALTFEQKRLQRRTLGIPDSCRFVVGTVGVLRPDRQPWLYVPIFAALARVFGPDIHFVLAGGGPERNHVESLITAAGLSDCVHITGPISDPYLVLSTMDLYLTLNVGPFCGVAAMEAALAGVPVIAIQMLRSYRSRPDDWIWSSQDTHEVANHAGALLRDESDRRELRKRQQAYALQNHTIEHMCRSYQQFYSVVLEQ